MPKPDQPADLQFHWADRPADASKYAAFFVANVEPSYISHGEIIDGRAIDGQTWSPRIKAIMAADFRKGLKNQKSDGSHLAVCALDGRLASIALIDVMGGVSLAILQDIVVSSEFRGHGVGGRFVEWIEKELSARFGIRRIMIESGVDNHGAHHFFQRRGFAISSHVLLKEI